MGTLTTRYACGHEIVTPMFNMPGEYLARKVRSCPGCPKPTIAEINAVHDRRGVQATDAERTAALFMPATPDELAMSRLDVIKAYRARTGSSLGQAVSAVPKA